MASFVFVQNKDALSWGTNQWNLKAPMFFESKEQAIEFGNKINKVFPRFSRDETRENAHMWVHLVCKTVRPRANISIYANGNVVMVNVPNFNGTLVIAD